MKPKYDIGRTTPSEQRIIDSYATNEVCKLLHAERSIGNYLLLYIERIGVRKTKKHVPPFKYYRAVITKRGKTITRYCGNIWDEECKDIIDDHTKIETHP